MRLSDLVARHARYRPEAMAVVFEETRLDWRAYSADLTGFIGPF
jgi:hypothetical protein